MWSWSFKRIGPRSYGRFQKLLLGNPARRNWTPHSQPTICTDCGFIFSFEGCDTFHLLSSCPVCKVAYQKDQHTHKECPNLDGIVVRFVRVGEIWETWRLSKVPASIARKKESLSVHEDYLVFIICGASKTLKKLGIAPEENHSFKGCCTDEHESSLFRLLGYYSSRWEIHNVK